jgi:regulator of nucleoside diphosphate kinase
MDPVIGAKKYESMQEKLMITTSDFDRLMGLPGVSVENNLPDHASCLFQNIATAKKFSPEKIDRRIVTMNSRVLLTETQSGRKSEVTITYPQDADPLNRRVSVLSVIGLALLGRKERDIVNWNIPSGIGKFEIVSVTYQPEAAGHFYL